MYGTIGLIFISGLVGLTLSFLAPNFRSAVIKASNKQQWIASAICIIALIVMFSALILVK